MPVKLRIVMVWLMLRAKAVYGKSGHPALEYLAGSIRLAQGRNEEAVVIFSKAVEHFPSSRALAYGWIDALLAVAKYDQAHALIADYQSLYPGDPWFYQRAAKAYAQQDKMMASGEHYARLYEYGLAIEQMQIALKQPGNDFYLLSSIEARQRELEANTKSRVKK